ncbi:MAG: energy transducer TonB, partial [Bacteroidota bacterium]
PDALETMDLGSIEDSFIEEIDIPIIPTPPPPPPKVVYDPIIKEVDNEEDIPEKEAIIQDVVDVQEVTDFQPAPVPTPTEIKKEETEPDFFIFAEVQPEPKGGMAAFYKYLGKKIKYPKLARRMQIEGRVFVQFVVDKDGSLTDIKVLKGIGGGCDEEAIRVLKEAPKWEAGRQRGKPVRVRMSVPIFFRLN